MKSKYGFHFYQSVCLIGLHIYQSIDSTNKAANQLIEAQSNSASGAVVLSEYQTMGRGRRGKDRGQRFNEGLAPQDGCRW